MAQLEKRRNRYPGGSRGGAGGFHHKQRPTDARTVAAPHTEAAERVTELVAERRERSAARAFAGRLKNALRRRRAA